MVPVRRVPAPRPDRRRHPRHTLDDRGVVSQVAAGWHICLDAADAMLDGRPLGPVQAGNAKKFGWDQLNERYAEHLGVYQSPGKG